MLLFFYKSNLELNMSQFIFDYCCEMDDKSINFYLWSASPKIYSHLWWSSYLSCAMLCFLIWSMLALISASNLFLLHFLHLRISSVSPPSSQLNPSRRIRISIDSCFHCIWNLGYQLPGIFYPNWGSFCWNLSCFVTPPTALNFSLWFCPIFSGIDLWAHCLMLKFIDCISFRKSWFIFWEFSGDVQELIVIWCDHHLIFWGYCICLKYLTFKDILHCRLIAPFPGNLSIFLGRLFGLGIFSGFSSALQFPSINLHQCKCTFDGLLFFGVGFLFLPESFFSFFPFILILLQKLAKSC